MPDSPPSIVPFARRSSGAVRLPDAPILVAGVARAAWLTADGEIEELTLREAASRALAEPPLLVHAPAQSKRLGLDRIASIDALELYAFVRPAKFCVPTPRGLAQAMGMTVPHALAAEAQAVREAVAALLAELAEPQIGRAHV